MQWSRLSDHVGRKPVLLIGTAGLCISMLCFGLSKTFVTLVIRCENRFFSLCSSPNILQSRCLVGMLNGNIGVMKSMMGGQLHEAFAEYIMTSEHDHIELTDSTNIAQGFSLMPIMWSAGMTIGYA